MKRILFTTTALLLFQLIVWAESVQEYEEAHALAQKEYEAGNMTASLMHAHDALTHAWQTDNDEYVTRSYMKIYQAQYKWKAYELAAATARQAIATSPDDHWKYGNYYNLGLAYKRMGMPDSSLLVFSEAYDYFLGQKNKTWVCYLLNEIGLSYYYAGEYATARKYYADLLDYSQHTGQEKYMGWALNNTGNAWLKSGRKDSAYHYFKLALEYNEGRHSLPTHFRLAEVAPDPYPHLIAAKNAYSNELDQADYLRVLHELRVYHQDPDSVNLYANLIADVSKSQMNAQEGLADYNQKLQILTVENKIAANKANEQRIRERNFWMIFVIVTVAVMALLAWLYVLANKRKWIPERYRYKNDQLEYANAEMIKTIRQFKSL